MTAAEVPTTPTRTPKRHERDSALLDVDVLEGPAPSLSRDPAPAGLPKPRSLQGRDRGPWKLDFRHLAL
eukprot:12602772-Heterocapsa_arctica.AAC.1